MSHIELSGIPPVERQLVHSIKKYTIDILKWESQTCIFFLGEDYLQHVILITAQTLKMRKTIFIFKSVYYGSIRIRFLKHSDMDPILLKGWHRRINRWSGARSGSNFESISKDTDKRNPQLTEAIQLFFSQYMLKYWNKIW